MTSQLVSSTSLLKDICFGNSWLCHNLTNSLRLDYQPQPRFIISEWWGQVSIFNCVFGDSGDKIFLKTPGNKYSNIYIIRMLQYSKGDIIPSHYPTHEINRLMNISILITFFGILLQLKKYVT